MRGPPPATPAQAPTHAAPASGEGAGHSQKHSAAEKAMSIYQDITFDGSRYVREKELCLFNKTHLLITHGACGLAICYAAKSRYETVSIDSLTRGENLKLGEIRRCHKSLRKADNISTNDGCRLCAYHGIV